jgi:N-acetylmuramoyl-L-alanine amidase
MSNPKKLIVIDAGHGGHDPGAVAGGFEEADINLEIAFALQRACIKAGFDAALTRTSDTHPSNESRATFSNRHGGDAYIALHCNASQSNMARGWEIIYGNGCPGGKSLAAHVASMIFWPIPARLDSVKAEANVGRGAGFRLSVLHNTRAPACLIEVGFLTNSFDRAFLTSHEGQDKIAVAISKGLLRYFA